MRLNEIHDLHQDHVEFFLIYIREAHPSDGWQTPQNLYDDIIYATPSNEDERAAIASTCQVNQDIRLPMLLDGIDNQIESHYISAPIRLFVIDRQGRVTFNGAPGPQGFDPELWLEAIEAEVAVAAA